MAGNVVLGGFIGAAVDAGTGAAKQLKPNPIKVTLVPLGTKEETPQSSAENPPDSVDVDGSENSDPPEEIENKKAVSFRINVSPIDTDHLLVSVKEMSET